ncbi:type I restriction enzyme, S subunit [Geodermatophilus siccatus]|uniref:Type I restriction enzyme, S subunit n=1 Tax=Geodermatophilus siccatus TaxID=1137991 RepID=A0A1G9QIM7_9ACTN|nr:restriction endonuclease subunit S [Geodermatophilus siccatus]SDM10631.1 type I restriction enzyme, S subunit [Geodermatophilus siccatus]
MTVLSLAEVADVNPRAIWKPALDEAVAFVPMAALNAETAQTAPGDTRPFREVSSGYTLFRDQDLLVAKITPCFENNKIGQANLRHEVGVGSSEFHVVRPKTDMVDARYLMHFLRQDRVRLEGERRMTGSGGQRRVPPAFLKELRLPVPPLEEQRRIVAILDEANRMLDLQRRQLEATDELAASLAYELLASTPRRERLADIAQRVTVGHVGPTADHVVAEGTPLLRTQNIGRGAVIKAGLIQIDEDLAGRLSKSRLRAGDVLISRHVVDEIRCAVLPSDLDGANCANMLLVSPSAELRGEVLSHFLRSQAAQDFLLGRRVGSAQKVVNTKVLQQLLVPVPERAEQERFCSVVRVLDRQAALRTSAAAETESLLAALEQRLFHPGSAVGATAK